MPLTAFMTCHTELDAVSNLRTSTCRSNSGCSLAPSATVASIRRSSVSILDVEQFRYQRFISDLTGMDIHGHEGLGRLGHFARRVIGSPTCRVASCRHDRAARL